MAIWTDPKVFQDTNNVNAGVMNTYLSENLRYLAARPSDTIIQRDIGTYTTTSTTLTPVDAVGLRATLNLQREAQVKYSLTAAISIASAGARTATMDVVMDGATYFSSGTGTPLSNGAWHIGHHTITDNIMRADWQVVFQNVPAGVHYFDLYWSMNVANTLSMYTNPSLMIRAEEIG